MSFLAPLYALGIAAVSLPILFHLIRRTPKGKQLFSSLMFLVPSPPRLTRRSRIENWLLLCLRALALILLAIAFSRPYLRQVLQVEADHGQGKHVVYVLDKSASMQRENLWQQATDKLIASLEELTPHDRASVLAFDRATEEVLRFDEWASVEPGARVALVRDRLQKVAPTWGSTDLGRALVAAADVLSEAEVAAGDAEATARVREVVLYSDLQQGSDLAALESYEWPQGVKLDTNRLATQAGTNAGLKFVAPADDAEGTASRIRVRVTNAGDSQHEQFTLRWNVPVTAEIAAGPEPNETDEQEPAPPQTTEVYVPPGQSRVVLAPPVPQGVEVSELLLEGDEQEFDNIAYRVPPVAERLQIIYLSNEEADNPDSALYYFQRAFPSTRQRQVTVTPRTVDASPVILPDEHPALVVVAADLPEASLKGVQGFVERGGTVLVVLKTAMAAQTFGLLAGQPQTSAEEHVGEEYTMLGEIDYTHPLFAPLADPRYGDFTKIRFWKYRRLEAPQRSRVLARFDTGDPALISTDLQDGRLYLLTTSWAPADGQLFRSSKFVLLLNRMLEQAVGEVGVQSDYEVGEPVTWPESFAGDQRIRIREPEGGSRQLAAGAARFEKTVRPGVYTAEAASKSRKFAVNLAANESKTSPLPLEELESRGVLLAHRPQGVSAETLAEQKRQMRARELEKQQKIWKWLIVAALITLVLESWLAGRTAHRLSGQMVTPGAAPATNDGGQA